MKGVAEIALSQIGIKEIVGDFHNPEVLKYFTEIGHAWVKNDELAWCSAFVNWVCLKAGKPYTKKLNARSWLDIGEKVDKPEVGDIVVLWRKRKDGPFGHVGFFCREDKGWVYILGGNQANKVCTMAYPKTRLLEYRRL